MAEMCGTYTILIAKHETKSPQQYMLLWTGFLWLQTAISTDSSKHINEHSVAIKSRKFLDLLSEY
jgi:hypothetical protein